MPSWRKRPSETDERLFAVAAWREAPYFSDAERAALALTEALTRISDRADPVPDDIWNEADKQFDEAELATLILGDCQHQCLEQAQRRGAAAGRGVEGLRRRLSGLSGRSASSRTARRSSPPCGLKA